MRFILRDCWKFYLLLGFLSAGLGAGTTEAVLVVNPMEVVKIRLQAQMHSLADPLETPQYRNAGHAVYKLVREEGFAVLYRGVTLTALRQATNQGVSAVCGYVMQIDTGAGANFTAYQELKKFAHRQQPELSDLPSYQHMIIGLISGAMGPFSNAPIDTIKTRSLSFALIDFRCLTLTAAMTRRFTEGNFPCRYVSDHADNFNCVRHVAT